MLNLQEEEYEPEAEIEKEDDQEHEEESKFQFSDNISSMIVEKSQVDSKAIPKDQRTTTKFMTKYEKARILGTRALQLRCPLNTDI